MPESRAEYQIVKQGPEEVILINAEGWSFAPSIELNPLVMASTVDKLVQNPSVSGITFSQRKKYQYDYHQTRMLVEIANIYQSLIRQRKILSLATLSVNESVSSYVPAWRTQIQDIIINYLRGDPIGAYLLLKRLIREEKIKKERSPPDLQDAYAGYLDILTHVHNLLEGTQLIQSVKVDLPGYNVGNRELYKTLFKPTITPDFIFTKLSIQPPLEGIEKEVYTINGANADVVIYDSPQDVKHLYHLTPPEFKLTEDKYQLLDIARNVLAEHKPRDEEFLDPEKMRNTFYNIGRDLLQELADNHNVELTNEELAELASILVRYTVGFGLVEVLLQDPKIQDISINSPPGQTPIFIVHEDYDDCVTNIIPSREDIDSWATKFRIISGRPLDEANPILDTELAIPGARARVGIIQKPLNPHGVAYSFRRHRDKPWTLPLFIHNRMMSPLAAGLLSFIIDGSRTMLFAGTRSSGKTALLGSTLIEIMRRYRLITVEDTLELSTDEMRKLGYNIQPMKVRSALTKGGTEIPADEGIRTSLRLGDSALIVGEIRSSIRGNENVIVVENGITRKIQIQELEGKDISTIYVPSMGYDLKYNLYKLKGFVKHPKRKKLLRVITRTGREISVTPDHSLFTQKNFTISPIECQELRIGDKIIIPEKIPSGYNDISELDLLQLLKNEDCKLVGYEEDLKFIIKKIGWKKATDIAECSNDIYQYLREGIQHTNIPIATYEKLTNAAEVKLNSQSLLIKRGTSNTLTAMLPLNEDFCRFLGYYVAEGWTEVNGNVIISNSNPTIIKDITDISTTLFSMKPVLRETQGLGNGVQMIFRNKVLGLVIKKLGCGRIAPEKRIPPILYGLSEEKICSFLRGYFDGDGSQSANESSGNSIRCSTVSKELADDMMYLLLQLGIVAKAHTRLNTALKENTQYIVEFKQRKYIKKFLEKVNFSKYQKKIIERSTSHSDLNTIQYDPDLLEQHVKLLRKYRHLRKYTSTGKEYLQQVVNEAPFASEQIKQFVNGEFFIDEIKEIQELNLPEGEYVYDLSVEPGQNFIGGSGGIMLHNTEASALYEAMRVGALANVVAGTIHGDSPYGVFDRVVNDLKVPTTSFKATDIIIVANPLKSPDGLHRWRRVIQITEVRKHWKDDPLAEKGFVDLMKYNPKTDQLEPTPELINGDSEIIKGIAGNVKEWAADWDAVWNNILLRADIKTKIVQYSQLYHLPQMLEAPFVISANDAFHKITEEVHASEGYLDTKQIAYLWEDWLKRATKQLQQGK